MASTGRINQARQLSVQQRSSSAGLVAATASPRNTSAALKSGPGLGLGPGPVSPPGKKLKPSTPFIGNLGVDIVDLYVGPEETLFRVHKNKICKIPYFDKLFNGNFKEAKENAARFPEDDCEAFDVLMEWIYIPSLPRFIRANSNLPGKSSLQIDSSWVLLEVYALAEKYCIPRLQNLAIDIIRREHKEQNKLPSAQYARQAYEKTSTGSTLARYVVSALYYTIDCSYSESDWPTAEVEELFQDLPTFASDYIKLQRSTSPMDPRDGSNCQYHSHRDGEECPSQRGKNNIAIKGAK